MSILASFAPSFQGGPPAAGPSTGPPPPPPWGSWNIGPYLEWTYEAFPYIGLPLREGDLVVTMFPDPVTECGTPPDGFCVKLVRGATDGPLGANYEAPFFSNEFGPPGDIWNMTNLGPVFGCCLDEAVPPNIYVAASTLYGNWAWGIGGSGAVYKLDGTTGAISVFITLPNSSDIGLGDICYDRVHDQFFVSNFEDGKIYRIKVISGTPTIVQAYDPWAQDDDAPDLLEPAVLGERIWAVHVPDNYWWDGRGLFFSAWLRDEGAPTEPWPASWPPLPGGETANNTIFRVQVNADGSINIVNPPAIAVVMPVLPAHTPQNSLPPHGATHSNPVSDIVSSGRVLILAEHRMEGPVGVPPWGHAARVLRYLFGPPSTPVLPTLYVGDIMAFGVDGGNSSGGVAIDVDNREDPTPLAANIWATGDALHYLPDDYIYGLQRLPAGGNGSDTPHSLLTYLIDMDHNTSSTCVDKEQIGDVEYFAGSLPLPFDPNKPHRFCSGDVYFLCPCDNLGDPGNGCSNSSNPAGAALDLAGDAATDNVVLLGSGMPNTSVCVYLQGTQSSEALFGDGVICVGGSLIRLRVRANVMGASSFPDGSDTVTLSQRGGVVPGSGAVRTYQIYYRNSAAFCMPEAFNVSNAWTVTW